MNISGALKNYFIPPGIWKLASDIKSRIRQPRQYPQFWRGATLPPLGGSRLIQNGEFFTATIAQETRTARVCRSGDSVLIGDFPDGGIQKSKIRFLFRNFYDVADFHMVKLFITWIPPTRDLGSIAHKLANLTPTRNIMSNASFLIAFTWP